MLENFHLAAIINEGSQTHLQRIPLRQALQDDLAKSWQIQYDSFFEEIQEIDFNASYQPDEHERFCLQNYDPPNWLAEENSQTISDIDVISHHTSIYSSIKGIVAFGQNDQGEELVLFQNFSQSRVIRPGRFLFLEGGTYQSPQRPGLTLDGKLSAIYKPAESKLLFQNFRTVNTFLPLAEFYKEASEQEILAVLNHNLLASKDPNTMATGANQWFRKRFAMFRDSGVLDNYSAQEIKSRSNGL